MVVSSHLTEKPDFIKNVFSLNNMSVAAIQMNEMNAMNEMNGIAGQGMSEVLSSILEKSSRVKQLQKK